MAEKTDILKKLDSYKDYANSYQQKQKTDEPVKEGESGEDIKNRIDKMKAKSIEEQIRETLAKIHQEEDETAKRIKEENRIKEEKRKKEEEMKAKIQEELRKIHELERKQADQIRKEQEKREAKRKKEEEEERAREQKRLELEAKKIKLKEQENKKVSLDKLKEQNRMREAEKKRKKAEEEKIKAELERRRNEEEKKRQKLVEEETKRLWKIEMEKEQIEKDRQRLAKLEEDRRISKEITERRQREKEEQKELKRLNEEEKAREIERSKKLALEEKKKSLFSAPKKPEPSFPMERPKKKIINNPFTQKFEEMAKEKELEEKRKEEIAKRKEKSLMKMKRMVSRSKQILRVLSKENLKASKSKLAQKCSKESINKKSVEKLCGSRNSLRRSKTCLNTNLGKSHGAVSKKDMQNYLISQVIFDRQENIQSSRNNLEKIKEEENKQKELDRIHREQVIKKQVQDELKRIKAIEEEQKLKAQEDDFNRYKQDMESYLNFVCEEPSSTKTKKRVKRKEPHKEQKLKLNIKDIKNQFEEEIVSSEATPSTDNTPFSPVNKINADEMFKHFEGNSNQQTKKKEYIPVIIDKDAFDRTCKLFEKEKKEEEERRANEERLAKRRAKMQEERERLIREREQEQQQEREHQEQLEEMRRQEQELLEEMEDEIEEEEDNLEDDLTAGNEEEPEEVEPIKPPVVDIQERIRQELEKISREEEIQKEKIRRENKKRELMNQIRNQIEQINSVNVTETLNNASWLNSAIQPPNEVKEPLALHDDHDIPKWIKIFQDKSKSIEDKRKKTEKVRAEMKTKADLKEIDSKEDETITMRNKDEKTKVSMKDRMRKVKSMIVDSGEKKASKEKPKVTKAKQETVAEFKDFLSEKYELLPMELKLKARHILSDQRSNELSEEPDQYEFNKYMDSLKLFLEKEGKNENEVAFKETISAYLDLLQTKQDTSLKSEQSEKKIGKVDTSFLFQDNNLKQSQSQVKVGKLETSKIENLVKEKEFSQESKILPEIKAATTSKLKDMFEQQDEQVQEFQKVVVKQKLINNSFAPNDDITPVKESTTHEWKYKKKTLEELHGFIKANSDMAPTLQLQQSDFKSNLDDVISSKDILNKSKEISNNMMSKEAEFEKFMKELESFTTLDSNSKDEELFKEELRAHLVSSEKAKTKNDTTKKQKITTALKLSDIKDKLTQGSDKSEERKEIKGIGKISGFQKKSNNESCSKPTLMKKNIESLLQPGKANILKKAFETAPKIKRSNSMADFNPGKLNVKEMFFPQPDNEIEVNFKPTKPIKKYSMHKTTKSEVKEQPKVAESKPTNPKKLESDWTRIEDPEERKKAVLAKYGFKAPRNIADDDSDIEDILNYEDTSDMAEYEAQLREQYSYIDLDSSRENSPEPKMKKTGSFSSLLNILKTMRKSQTSKTFSSSKAKVNDFSDSANLQRSCVDLSDITGSSTNIKDMFETGKAFHSERRRSMMVEEDYMKEISMAERKAEWEKSLKNSNSSKSRNDLEFEDIPDISPVKDRFENKSFANPSFDKNPRRLSKLRHEVELTEDDFSGSQTIDEELDALRSSSHLSAMKRIERGRQVDRSEPPRAGLRRSTSCVGIAGESINPCADLDEETMQEISESKKMVKAMFESSAPKYTFGGSGSNLSKSKEDIRKGPVTRPSARPKEERKWVVDTINKFFEVIVEENDEENEDDLFEDDVSDDLESNDDNEESSEYSEYSEYSDEGAKEDVTTAAPSAQEYKSSNRIRGLLGSVASKFTKSVGNLAGVGNTNLVGNLKKNLGSQISLRASTLDLDK